MDFVAVVQQLLKCYSLVMATSHVLINGAIPLGDALRVAEEVTENNHHIKDTITLGVLLSEAMTRGGYFCPAEPLPHALPSLVGVRRNCGVTLVGSPSQCFTSLLPVRGIEL